MGLKECAAPDSLSWLMRSCGPVAECCVQLSAGSNVAAVALVLLFGC